ncbi:MAG: hypothetical protein GYA87_09175 [Christensenellaceae bacterium]|nr:hypothetical protein [Christensenellaceae bacterium]
MQTKKHLVLFCIIAYMLLFIRPILSEQFDNNNLTSKQSNTTTTRRALILTCDTFINHPDTSGASKQNGDEINRIFADEELDINEVYNYHDTIGNEETFRYIISNTFKDSKPDDINYIYISTHGLYINETDQASLVFSNGNEEFSLDAEIIEEAFKDVKGTHFFIIDACNSGALIGRGISGGSSKSTFYGDRFKIICSSGGSEDSWYWSSSGDGSLVLQGAGYFSSALARALSKENNYPADLNRDENISLFELYNYLYYNHAPSVPQVYPYGDNFSIFTYSKQNIVRDEHISNLTFETTVISSNNPYVSFNFIVEKPIIPVYQIVYFENGKWQFNKAQFIYDIASRTNQEGVYNNLRPGLYNRKISINHSGSGGYALIYVHQLSGKTMRFISGKVLSVLPDDGLEKVQVMTDTAFQPLYGQELPITIQHNVPCLMDINIVDNNGNLINTIKYNEPTRPQNLLPKGSTFVWNGKDNMGNFAKPGMYSVSISCKLPKQTVSFSSKPFELLESKIPIGLINNN